MNDALLITEIKKFDPKLFALIKRSNLGNYMARFVLEQKQKQKQNHLAK